MAAAGDPEALNILYVSGVVPYPPNRGDKLRAYNQLKHLGVRHHIWCAAYAEDPGERLYAALLQRWCREVRVLRAGGIGAGIRRLMETAMRRIESHPWCGDRRMVHIAQQWASAVRFDVAIAFGSRVADVALESDARVRILDYCDLDSRAWFGRIRRDDPNSSRGASVGASRISECERERERLRRFDHVVVMSHAEAATLVSGAEDGIKVSLVGNGVALASQRDLEPVHSGIVGFVGTMNYPPNEDAVVWFADAIWPGIRARYPVARFQIVGRAPTRRVRALSRRPGVEVAGEVKHVWDAMRHWQVAVAPIRMGRCLQHKVLEAMAASRPVVVTAEAAVGLTARDVDHVIVANSAEEFETQVSRLLGDPQECLRLGRAARQAVAREHSWPHEILQLERLFPNKHSTLSTATIPAEG